MELLDVGVIPIIRCPRGIGPLASGLDEAMRGEELDDNDGTVANLRSRSEL